MWWMSTMPGNGPSPSGRATYAWISSPPPPGNVVIRAVTLTGPAVENEFHIGFPTFVAALARSGAGVLSITPGYGRRAGPVRPQGLDTCPGRPYRGRCRFNDSG